MNRQLIIELLQNKTQEIQMLLEHFKNSPNEIETSIILLENRVESLNRDIQLLKNKNFETQNSEKSEPVKLDHLEEKSIPNAEIKQQIDSSNDKNPIIIEKVEIGNTNNSIKTEHNQASEHHKIETHIGINDHFLFSRELFNNCSDDLNYAISEINQLGTINELDIWFQKKEWDQESETVNRFYDICKKSF
ncbi:MAG: hypothetical protein N4A49_00675 [Marinifilaceae bacterium]|jgi:hypothetical protein|nr:hypothetical protein [Marinifilaceae bacterium]